MVRHTGAYDCRLDIKERLHLFGLMIEVNGWLSPFITFRQYLVLLLSSQRNYLHCTAQSETVVLAVHSHVCYQQQSLMSVSIIFTVEYQEVRSDVNVKTFTQIKRSPAQYYQLRFSFDFREANHLTCLKCFSTQNQS